MYIIINSNNLQHMDTKGPFVFDYTLAPIPILCHQKKHKPHIIFP